MTMREKIEAVRATQDYEAEIESKLCEIVKDTYDYHIDCIDDFVIGDDLIDVYYTYSYRGYPDRDSCFIPVKWLDEGFDYRAAYEEQKRKAEEERKIREAEEKKRKEEEKKAAEKRKAENEYKQYLKLKEKYESNAVWA